ncbi:MAG: hypothetical protein IGS38_21220 [Synechococcales cyanobacterium M58_A2018_015]|nr:hypothetical protein [Synechococcales cyanobacterium M58_A2018_015]
MPPNKLSPIRLQPLSNAEGLLQQACCDNLDNLPGRAASGKSLVSP